MDKVCHISEKELPESQEDIFTLDINYGPDHERVWQKFENNITGQTIEKRYFTIENEKVETTNSALFFGSISKK